MLKTDKSPGVDNLPAEVLKLEGPGIIDALTVGDMLEKCGPVSDAQEPDTHSH